MTLSSLHVGPETESPEFLTFFLKTKIADTLAQDLRKIAYDKI